MTIEVTITCDGFGCDNSAELEDSDQYPESIGWGETYHGEFHYCPSCFPIVLEEIEEGYDN